MSASPSIASAFAAAVRKAAGRLGLHALSPRGEEEGAALTPTPPVTAGHNPDPDPPPPATEEEPSQARFEPMTIERLDAVLVVEHAAYSHPWSRENFIDSLAAGYQAQCLLAGDELLGYLVAMPGYQEMHLLNLAVAPAFQCQGWARVMLDALVLWSRGQGAQWLWLEVRVGNVRALKIYQQQGFAQVGERKGYYPLNDGEREDAVVMNLSLATDAGQRGSSA
jgi:ribosomal-protein-alanine N-acetyltransferase